MPLNVIPSKKVLDFYSINVTDNIRTKKHIEKKGKRKVIINKFVLENGCVAYKISDTIIYQFTPERTNDMIKTSLKNLNELKDFIQNADEELIEEMTDDNKMIFSQKIEYSEERNAKNY